MVMQRTSGGMVQTAHGQDGLDLDKHVTPHRRSRPRGELVVVPAPLKWLLPYWDSGYRNRLYWLKLREALKVYLGGAASQVVVKRSSGQALRKPRTASDSTMSSKYFCSVPCLRTRKHKLIRWREIQRAWSSCSELSDNSVTPNLAETVPRPRSPTIPAYSGSGLAPLSLRSSSVSHHPSPFGQETPDCPEPSWSLSCQLFRTAS